MRGQEIECERMSEETKRVQSKEEEEERKKVGGKRRDREIDERVAEISRDWRDMGRKETKMRSSGQVFMCFSSQKGLHMYMCCCWCQ